MIEEEEERRRGMTVWRFHFHVRLRADGCAVHVPPPPPESRSPPPLTEAAPLDPERDQVRTASRSDYFFLFPRRFTRPTNDDWTRELLGAGKGE